MINKYLQEILQKFPDDAEIFFDSSMEDEYRPQDMRFSLQKEDEEYGENKRMTFGWAKRKANLVKRISMTN